MAAGVLAGVGVISGLSGSGETPPAAPYLHDVTGRLQIGCGFDGAVSAPEICQDGRVIGVYLDDSSPRLKYWLGLAVAKYPQGIVLVSIPMSNPTWRYGPSPPVLNCHEWYPVGSGAPLWAWGPFPTERQCYVIQRYYGGYRTENGFASRPPTRSQYLYWLAKTRLQQPEEIFAY